MQRFCWNMMSLIWKAKKKKKIQPSSLQQLWSLQWQRTGMPSSLVHNWLRLPILGAYPAHYVMRKSLPCLLVKEALSQHRCSLPRKDSTLWSWEVCRTFSVWCCNCFSVLDRRPGTCFSEGNTWAWSSISVDVLRDVATGCGLQHMGSL